MIHRVKGFGIVKKAEVDVFLEISCFFYDPMDVGNLISEAERFPREGHGNLLQYSSLENPMGRGAWWTTVHRFPKNQKTEATERICVLHSTL